MAAQGKGAPSRRVSFFYCSSKPSRTTFPIFPNSNGPPGCRCECLASYAGLAPIPPSANVCALFPRPPSALPPASLFQAYARSALRAQHMLQPCNTRQCCLIGKASQAHVGTDQAGVGTTQARIAIQSIKARKPICAFRGHAATTIYIGLVRIFNSV